MQTRVAEMLGVEFPILAFSHCRDVVAAVTNAGGFGVLGAVAHSPGASRSTCRGSTSRCAAGRTASTCCCRSGTRSATTTRSSIVRRSASSCRPSSRSSSTRSFVGYDVPALPDEDEARVGGMSVSEGRVGNLLDVAFGHPIRLVASALGAPPPSSSSEPTTPASSSPPSPARSSTPPPRIREGCRPDRRPRHRGGRPHRHDRHDGARARGRRRRRPDTGAGGRRHRPRPPDRRSARPRRRRRVVRLGLADHRGSRDQPGGAAEVPRRDLERHRALALADGQAGADAAQRVDGRVGGAGAPGALADAAADRARDTGAAAHQPPPERPAPVRTSSRPTSSARSSAR